MGFHKNYLLQLLKSCSDDAAEQDRIEAELHRVRLTHHLDTDVRTIHEQILNQPQPQAA